MIKTDVVIIGAGPVGLFAVHQLGIKGLKSEVIDNLDRAGGQCIELYPDKPIYDIAGIPQCTGEELTKNLLEQIKPFKTNFHFNERVQEIKNEGNNWVVKTSQNKVFTSPNIIIAGGVGSFEPRKLSVKDAEKYEGKNIFYSVSDKKKFRDKKISIFGGGDSALDWALELSKVAKVTLIHRRDEFRGAPHTLSEIQKEGKVDIKTKYQLSSIKGDNNIKVNSENFETNKIGIFAIGDICSYPGILKLILSGFHEGALASVECFKRARPNEKYRFEFTTSSKDIQARLGIKNK